MWDFSSFGKWGLLFSYSVQASPWRGFSLQRMDPRHVVWALVAVGSKLSSCGTGARLPYGV